MPTTRRVSTAASPPLPKAHVVNSPPLKHADSQKFVFNGPSWPPRRVSSGNVHKVDRHIMQPDEYFERYTVSEVKTILARLRSDVDAKQQELRMMVGERYRDLLQASSSIISIAESSNRVQEALEEVRQTVNAENPGKTPIHEPHAVTKDDAILRSLQSLAAHLKLLLDAPEHLWRLLEQKRYLRATWLFLLSRIVHRSLSREDIEDEERWERFGVVVQEQFPIAQRQWETISHFRAQISHKAALSLRDVTLSSQEVCSAMLSLHLLDSLPIADALDSFLKHRLRSVQSLLSSERNVKIAMTLKSDKSSKAPKPEKKTSREAFEATRNAISAIASTLGTARDILHVGQNKSPSLLVKVLAYLQVDTPSGSITSIPEELQLTTQSLLASLPSSGHFSFLPESIVSYKPFIDLESPSSRVQQDVLEAKLRTWMDGVIEQLETSMRSWFSRLETARGVWDVRNLVKEWLDANESFNEVEKTRIRALLDSVCSKRVEEIWNATLNAMESTLKANLTSLLNNVNEGHVDAEQETYPVRFLLSSPQLPSASNANANSSVIVASFERYHKALQQRVCGDTPLLETLASDLETTASGVRKDSDISLQDESCGKSLRNACSAQAETSMNMILSNVETVFESPCNSEMSSTILLGRLARKLQLSDCLDQLNCSQTFKDSFGVRSQVLYDRAVTRWRDAALHKALAEIQPTPCASTGKGGQTGPSAPLIAALRHLSDSLQRWAYFDDEENRSTLAKGLLEEFVARIHPQGSKPERLVAMWDLCFLRTICVEWDGALTSSVKLLDTLIEQFSDSSSTIQQRADVYVQNIRFLLVPLLPQVKQQSVVAVSALRSPAVTSPKSPQPPTVRPESPSSVGKSGKPDIGNLFGEEMGPVMNIVKPTPRFGSLWVGSAGV